MSEFTKVYHRKRPMRIFITLVLIVATIAIGIYSLCANDFDITFQEAWQAVWHRIVGIKPETYIDRMIDKIAIEYNAPRAFAAVFVGTTLAISGVVMQTVTHNPLAEPYTIGISSAALLGVTLSIVFGFSVIPGLTGDVAIASSAFLFALIPAMAIVAVSSFKKMSPNMMILIGIGMMYLFSSITTFIKFNASDEKLEKIYIWSLGTLSETTWQELVPMLIATLVVFFGFLILASRINVMMAGDKVCLSLGVNPVHLRIACFLLVSMGVAVMVCFTGTLGFVGLVAPHIARLFTGNNNKILIPVSAVIGSLLVLSGDVIVRSIPGGLPVGVVTALIGSPLFIFFLFRERKKRTF